MSEAFDPYHRWLGIAPKDQPPHNYRLLGIDLFEGDAEVIRDATERQMVHVRKYQLGPHSEISQKILNQLSSAKACLLNADKKAAYDAGIKAKLGAADSSMVRIDAPPPPPLPTPLPPPPIAKEPYLPAVKAAQKAKTKDRIDKNGLRRSNKNIPIYVGFGIAVIIGGVLVTIFAAIGDNGGLKIPKPGDQIAKSTAPGEQNPPKPLLQNKKPDNAKPNGPISGGTAADEPPSKERKTPGGSPVVVDEGRIEGFSMEPKTGLEQDKDKVADENPSPLKAETAEHNDEELPPKENIPAEELPKDTKIRIPKTLPIAKSPRSSVQKDIPIAISDLRSSKIPHVASSSDNRYEQALERLFEAFNNKDFLELRRDFADGSEAVWPVQASTKIFRTLRTRYGKITNWDPPAISDIQVPNNQSFSLQPAGAVNLLVQKVNWITAKKANCLAYCENGTIEFNVVFNQQYKIIGLQSIPGKKSIK